MRKVILPVIIGLVFAAGMAREMKIAYFSSDKLREEWGEWKDAQAKFDQDVALWQEEAQNMETEIASLMEEYQRQELLLSEDKRREKEMLIQQKQLEYQQFLTNIFSEDGKAAQRNAELTSPLHDQISRTLSRMADRDEYTVIFDVAAIGIAYIDPSLDITDDLLNELKTGQ